MGEYYDKNNSITQFINLDYSSKGLIHFNAEFANLAIRLLSIKKLLKYPYFKRLMTTYSNSFRQIICSELGILLEKIPPNDVDVTVESMKELLLLNHYLLDIHPLKDFMNLCLKKLSDKKLETSGLNDAAEEVIVPSFRTTRQSLHQVFESINQIPDRALTVRDLGGCLTVFANYLEERDNRQSRALQNFIQTNNNTIVQEIRESRSNIERNLKSNTVPVISLVYDNY